jgi:hypothetical protein
MNIFDWFDLQLFGGEGAGAGASGGASSGEGGGQASGDGATVAAEQRLRELGVPADRARKRASKMATSMPAAEGKSTSNTVTAAVDNNDQPTTEEGETNSPPRLTWNDIKRDPEYKKAYDDEMQRAIMSRLKTERSASQAAKDALSAMAPAMEVMARKYGLDAKNMDYNALANAINNDDAYYEQKAIEMGTSIETAKRVDQMEREDARRKEQEKIALEDQARRAHIVKLAQQGEALKATFPTFNLGEELRNPTFARLVDPRVGMSVEDAYHAVHRKEIQAAQMQYAAKKTAENMSNAIQAGKKRPDELGSSGQAPSVSTFDYKNASKEQREALKRQIREAHARGEKLYPH